MRNNDKTTSLFMLLLFVFLFLFGFSNIKEYGRPWDEQTEIYILLSNAKEYAHLPLFRGRFTDSRIMQVNVPIISESVERDHGIAAYYGFLPIYWRVQNSTLAISYAWHVYTYVLWFLGVIFFYLLVKEVYFSAVIPPIGVMMFFFTPRLFAEGHYNNKDIVFLVFVIATLAFAVRIMKYFRWRDILLFSVTSAFLMNGKILGIAIWGFTGLSVIAHTIIRKNVDHRSSSIKLLTAAVLSAICYVFLTPAIWNNPGLFIRYCVENANHFSQSRWDFMFSFRGFVIRPAQNGIPYSYLPLWIFMTTPIYILLLFLSSCAMLLITLIKGKARFFEQDREWFVALSLLIFIFPFLHIVFHAHSTVLYNGWRHCYFLYAPLCLCSLYLPDVLLQRKPGESVLVCSKAMILSAVLIIAGFASTFADMIQNRSYEYVYFNRIARLLWSPSDFEGDYWNVSVLPVLRQFSDQRYDKEAGPIKINLETYTKGGQQWTIEELQAEGQYQFVPADEADYYLINVSALTEKERRSLADYELVYSERHFSSDLSSVFIRKS